MNSVSDEDLPLEPHSRGIEVWAQPKDGDLEAIIVFVHGVDDSRVTWSSKTGDVLWPRKFLAKEFPKALILGFSYYSDLTVWVEWTPIMSIARLLLHDLGRRLNTIQDKTGSYTPLVFVCHSMGGIVCQQALAMAHDTETNIFLATVGIIFMGTPQVGSNTAAWRSVIEGLAWKVYRIRLSRDISISIKYLAQLQVDFFRLICERPSGQEMQFTCFHEHMWVGVGNEFCPTEWRILPGHNNINLNSEHVDMTRFHGVNDSRYKIFVDQLRKMISRRLVETRSNEFRYIAIPDLVATIGTFERNFWLPLNVRHWFSAISGVDLFIKRIRIYLRSFNFNRAEALQWAFLECTRLSYGPLDRRTIVIKKNLGTLCYLSGKWQEAEIVLRETLEDTKVVFDQDDQRIANAMSSLAFILCCQGKFEAAEKLQEGAVNIKSQKLGHDHLDTLKEQALHARILAKRGETRKAAAIRAAAFKRTNEVLGPDHADTVKAAGEVVLSNIDDGQLETAEHAQRELETRCRRLFAPVGPITQKETRTLVHVLMRRGHQKEAATLQSEMVRVMGQMFGKEHPDTLQAIQTLAICASQRGNQQGAITWQTEVCEAQSRAFGATHPLTKESQKILEALEKGVFVESLY